MTTAKHPLRTGGLLIKTDALIRRRAHAGGAIPRRYGDLHLTPSPPWSTGYEWIDHTRKVQQYQKHLSRTRR